MAVQWADVSSYQAVVNDAYPHPVLAIRSNDGTYRDPKFAANFAWARRALDDGRLAALIVYCVYRTNWQQTADTMIDMVGTPPHPKVVAMVDVESWGGQIQGNQSDGINRLYWRLADWLGDPRRVIGYGNRGDLVTLWPMRPPNVQLVVAAYGGPRPTYPGMLAHQHGDDVACDPFGPCDGNVAYDHDVESLTAALGISAAPTRRRRVAMSYRIDPTPIPTGAGPDTVPDGSWSAVEHVITTPGPSGGWSGKIMEHLTLGWMGGYIQEAWSGPSGKHFVDRYDATKKTGGRYVKPFDTQCYEIPAGDRFLVVRLATRNFGDVTPETEH
jgi:hypothetical protein